ncbi:MAG: phosphoribosylglycinamide formyltransferase [Dokdonella sp.]
MTSPTSQQARESLRIVTFASGRGSNFAALIAARRDGRLPIELAALLSDRDDAAALDAARQAGIDAVALSPHDYPDRGAFDRAIFARAQQYAPDLIVLAGYMRIIAPAVVSSWQGRMINVHPSLLPKYRGLHTHRRALEAGDAVHGASVHYVTAELDGGPTIAQVEIPILVGDTPETLAARLLSQEHRLLVASIALIAEGRVVLTDSGVVLDAAPLAAPLRLGADGMLA